LVRVAAPEPGAWPLRRRYEITASGEAYLHFWADALKDYREEMDAFLRLYERSAKGGVCGKA
jgi:DNA-binding PadR family transcriptional regulator